MRNQSKTIRPTFFEPLESRTYLAAFRPPSVPLVVNNPFLSVWSNANNLTDDVTRQWTGAQQPLISLIKIDGQTYRLMGAQPAGLNVSIAAFPQIGVQVTPTRSIYDFDNGDVHVRLGRLLLRRDDRAGALREARAALRVQPKSLAATEIAASASGAAR